MTQLLITHYDCSKQNDRRQISITRVQKSTHTPPEIEYTRTIASVFVRAKAEISKAFPHNATIQTNGVFRFQGAHSKYYMHDCMHCQPTSQHRSRS